MGFTLLSVYLNKKQCNPLHHNIIIIFCGSSPIWVVLYPVLALAGGASSSDAIVLECFALWCMTSDHVPGAVASCRILPRGHKSRTHLINYQTINYFGHTTVSWGATVPRFSENAGYGHFPSLWHDVTLLNSTVLLKPVCGDPTYVLFPPQNIWPMRLILLNPFCYMYVVNKYSSVRGGDLYSYDVNYY